MQLRVRFLLLIPWPMLYLGYWSLYHVKGPASEGFGMGGYASAIASAAYGISLYALNRAVVYSRHAPRTRSGDRVSYGIAVALYAAGILGMVPMLFFIMIGFPLSLVGGVLIAMALMRWKGPTGESRDAGVGA